jgi:hypothetical protein
MGTFPGISLLTQHCVDYSGLTNSGSTNQVRGR